jgi:tetratricopeptide (TPR) repeat protein
MATIDTQPNARRRRRPRIPDRWTSIRDALLVVVVLASALAIGSVHIPALLGVAAIALIAAALELWALRQVPWPSVVLAGLGLFSALQAVALPAAWVKRLSPASAEVWLSCLVPFGEPALQRFPVSLDAGASIAEALKWLTYASVYLMATRVRARRGSAWLSLLLFGSAALIAFITLVHGVADLAVLYAVYEPTFTVGRWSVGPLLNSNNLGGYAILGLFSGGGLLLSGRSPAPRSALIIGLAVISTALCLSGSRAAILSVVIFGVVALAWLARGQVWRVPGRGLMLGLAPLIIGVAIAIALGTAKDAGQLATLDVRRKVSVWLWALPMIREHTLCGVGRGAFESAFSQYRQALDYDWSIVVSHAENFIVQWIAEWGAPVGGAAVVLVVGYVARAWRASRSDRLRFLVMTGLVALLAQNLADLGLEVPAVAIAAVLALAAGEHPPKTTSDEAKGSGWLVFAASASAFVVWVAALAWSRSPVELERREMSVGYRELAIDSAEERGKFRSRLREAVLRHPGEPFFPLLGSRLAMRMRDNSALVWAARSLALAPANGRVHLALAELLRAHGATAQAMLHLRLAGQYDRTLAGAVGANAALWAPSIDLLMQAIPEGPHGEGVLLDACARKRPEDAAPDCFRRAALAYPKSPQAHQQLAEALLRATRAEQPPCTGTSVERCITDAELAIRSAERLEPKSWRSGYLMSNVLLARGDTLGAAQLLARICPASAEGDECRKEALTAALKSRSNDAIATAADGFAVRPCEEMESCADRFSWLASQLESGGMPALAMKYFSKAAETDPSAARWLDVAEHATQAHLYGVATAALERAGRSPDASISSGVRAQQLRERVARATSRPD